MSRKLFSPGKFLFELEAPLDRWDRYYLQMARAASLMSKDPSTQVGAVLVSPHNAVLSTGFNGFARGVKDCPGRYEVREIKLKMIVHAEANALIHATGSVRGATVYTYPFPPCSQCAALLIQAGIVRAVAPEPTREQYLRWKESFDWADTQFREAGVRLHLIREDF